jgi:hypothetical protein
MSTTVSTNFDGTWLVWGEAITLSNLNCGQISVGAVKEGSYSLSTNKLVFLLKFLLVEAFRGCPDDRDNMEFFLAIEDHLPCWIRWCDSFSENSAFQRFCGKIPQLRQLLLSQRDANKLRKTCLSLPITLVKPGMTVFVDLRSWSPSWYSQLSLPNKDKLTYVTRCVYGKYCGAPGQRKTKILSTYPDMSNEVFEVDNWFVTTYGHQSYRGRRFILLNARLIEKHKLGPKRRYNKRKH